MNEKKNILKKKANTLPLLPGVYIMRDAADNIIYIGKAVKLKNRVTQYFGSEANHSLKVRRMVEKVDKFDYIVCDSEFEALTLENSLIKQYQPKYNILLKDDKGYHYVHITDEKWRRIEAAKSDKGKGLFIGPFNSGRVVKQTVEQAQKIFKIPNCSRNLDKPSKPCLNFHIGQCSAPCKQKISLEEYNESLNSAIAFIKNGGSGEEDISKLYSLMERAAEELNFEYAARLRDRINSIKRISEKQKVISSDIHRHDCFAVVAAGDKVCIEVFIFKNGHLADQDHYIFDDLGSKEELYSEFLPQYYANGNDIPRELLMDAEPMDANAICDWLSQKSGHTVSLSIPQRGDKKRLMEMCASNAAEQLSHIIERNMHETAALSEIAGLLGLSRPPRYIEAYDVSNISGSENVAGMVVFKDGRPLKSAYRKFKINSFCGQDDFRSMAEVLDRRFAEYEKGADEAFSVLPDLILLDGGQGQLSAVMPVIEKYGFNINVFGMVKDNKHRTNAIASSGGSIAIKSNRSAFSLITKIQDEVHRFAISFHKARRSAAMTATELTEIEGVGSKRARALLKHFKSIKKIKEADIAELSAVEGINSQIASKIHKYFNG